MPILKSFISALLFLVFLSPLQAQQKLKVSANGRYLVKEDGSPFFYLGDTGWEMFHKLNASDTYLYLSNRASKGFTVIQSVLLAEINGLTEPNANGDHPFTSLDSLTPNEKYFKHIDNVVSMVASLNLYMAILPTWGAWVGKKNHPLFPSIQLFNATNAQAYGRYLGQRYKNNPNIIWVLGGDRNPNGFEKVWEAMATGLMEGDGRNHLITYHPTGEWSSSHFWHNAPWLDFNMAQSGHASRFNNSYDYIQHDYNLKPVKPTFDGETNYEDHPVSFDAANGWFSDYDIRTTSYFSVFAGAFGVTYGCNNIWQMNTGQRQIAAARRTWKESLDLPGAYQMRYLKNLIESRPYLTRIPDQSLIIHNNNSMLPRHTGSKYVGATRDGTIGKDGATYIMVYLPVSKGIKVNTTAIKSKSLRAWWYDPRNGTAIPLGNVENRDTFEPDWNSLPWRNGSGPDWVLVLDDATKNYAPPGQKTF